MCNISPFQIIILIISTVILLTCYLIYFNAPNIVNYIKENNVKLTDINMLLNDANNGDLIFLAGDTRGERVCRWMSRSTYSHVGLLFRESHTTLSHVDDSILYVWEADLGQHTRDGPRLIKLTDKLKLYKGLPYLMWRPLKGNRPSTVDILTIVNRYKNVNFDNRMLTWATSHINNKLSDWLKNNDRVFCSELIAITLRDLGIINNHILPQSYSPESFTKNIKGLISSYHYKDPIYIKFT